jgi:hypothetical protein
MWDSSTDHTFQTVLLFFADTFDPLGPAELKGGGGNTEQFVNVYRRARKTSHRFTIPMNRGCYLCICPGTKCFRGNCIHKEDHLKWEPVLGFEHKTGMGSR